MGKIKQQWLALDPRVRAALQVTGVVVLILMASEDARVAFLEGSYLEFLLPAR
jgi:hypothetical protein